MQLRSLYIYISNKLKAFCVTQNETSKMLKKSASTNKLSHNFVEHIPWIIIWSLIVWTRGNTTITDQGIIWEYQVRG